MAQIIAHLSMNMSRKVVKKHQHFSFLFWIWKDLVRKQHLQKGGTLLSEVTLARWVVETHLHPCELCSTTLPSETGMVIWKRMLIGSFWVQKGAHHTLHMLPCLSTVKAEDWLGRLYLCIYKSWHEDAQTFFDAAHRYSSLYIFVTWDISNFLSVTF